MLLSTALNITKMKFNTLRDLKSLILFIQFGFAVYIIFDFKTSRVIAMEHPNVKNTPLRRSVHFLKGSLLHFTLECVVLPVP